MKSANMMPISLKETGLKATRKVRQIMINHGWPLKLSRLTTVVRDLCPVRSSTLEIILPRPAAVPEQCVVEVAPANSPPPPPPPAASKAVYDRVMSNKMNRRLMVLLLVCFILAFFVYVYTLTLLLKKSCISRRLSASR